MSKSYFGVSTVLFAFGGYCTEEGYKLNIFNAVHYVRGEGFGDVNKFGCLIGVKVFREVCSLAYCGAGGLDGVVAEVRSLVVRDIVSLFYLAREGVAETLFKVLSVVVVGSFDFGDLKSFHC